MYQTVRYEKKDNIGIATINRPEALNALNSQVIADLEALIGEVEQDAGLQIVQVWKFNQCWRNKGALG